MHFGRTARGRTHIPMPVLLFPACLAAHDSVRKTASSRRTRDTACAHRLSGDEGRAVLQKGSSSSTLARAPRAARRATEPCFCGTMSMVATLTDVVKRRRSDKWLCSSARGPGRRRYRGLGIGRMVVVRRLDWRRRILGQTPHTLALVALIPRDGAAALVETIAHLTDTRAVAVRTVALDRHRTLAPDGKPTKNCAVRPDSVEAVSSTRGDRRETDPTRRSQRSRSLFALRSPRSLRYTFVSAFSDRQFSVGRSM